MRPFLCLLATLLIFRLSTEAQSTLIEVSGPVSGSWTTDTVLVTGDIEVLSGEALIIDPGTLVLFTGHFTFMVKGSVEAAGSPSEPVRFSIADTSGFHDTLSDAGGWHGFVYEHLAAGADSSLFDHCIFEYGKAFSADTFGQFGGAFRVFGFDRIAFRNCVFANNLAIRWGGAVYARNSNILFDCCTFTANTCGLANFPWGYGGGLCSVLSEPTVTNCYFASNSATGFGGGASFEYSDPVVRFNTFYNNYGGLGGGFGFIRSATTQVVSNNLVYGNTAHFFGGGFACIRSNTVFSNLTVTGNQSAYGGGFYCNDSAVPVLYNTIIYGNEGFGHEVYIWDVRSAPSFLYSDIEGDTTDFEGSGAHGGYQGTYDHNINADPLFRNTGDFPYALLSGSPCIDAGTPDTAGLQLHGTDLEGLSRIYNGKIDIGAFEWNPGQGNAQWPVVTSKLSVVPNPAFTHLTIRLRSIEVWAGQLRVISMDGSEVYCSGIIRLYPGENTVSWDLKDHSGNRVSPGSYICLLTGRSCIVVIQ